MATIEQRVSALESAVADLRERVADRRPWPVRIQGSMAEFPEFEEVLRLGRELRSGEQEAKGSVSNYG